MSGNRWVVLGALVLALSGCDDSDEGDSADPADAAVQHLADAADDCAEKGQPRLGDDGHTLTVVSPGGGPRSGRVATKVSTCVLAAIDVPDSVVAKIEATTAMMGSQNDTWDAYELTWTYHPDQGLQIIVEVA